MNSLKLISGISSQQVSNGLLNGLLPYWKVDESSGTRFDSNGSRDLTPNGVGYTASGKINGAATFARASTQNLTVTNSDIWGITGAFSVSIWAYMSSALNNQGLGVIGQWRKGLGEGKFVIYKQGSGSNELLFALSSDGSTNAIVFTGPVISVYDTWYHILAVYVPSTAVRLYVNGTKYEETTGVPAAVYGAASGLLEVGSANAADYMDGRLDECCIWNTDLSDEQAGLVYGGGAGLPLSKFTY